MILTLDLSLWSLVLAVITIGVWLGKTRVKGWAVPINTILGFVSVILAVAWGLLLRGVSLSTVFTYGLPNGVMVWLGATALYDFAHEFIKRRYEWAEVWSKICALLKSRKKEAMA